MFGATPLELAKDQDVFVVIDPAAGGPSSDYAVVSLVRQRGIVTVYSRAHTHAIRYTSLHLPANVRTSCDEQKKPVTSSCRRSR